MSFRNISGTINYTMGSVAYGSVAMPATVSCKSMYIKSATAFKIAAGSAGTDPVSIAAGEALPLDLIKNPGELICWAKADSGTPTLEVLLFNA